MTLVRRLAVVPAALVLALGAAGPAGAGTAATAGPDRSVEDVIDREMPASGVPGLAYAVVADGQVTAAGARGAVRAGEGDAATADTAFPTGSISKSFTALAVMQLVEDGQVDLEVPVSEYLDAFVGRPGGTVTIRQLLSHTSGFSTVQGNTSYSDVTGEPDELERRVEELADVTPAHAPEDSWEYSNANYLVAGRLVEVVSGEPFQDYVERHILRPVGMADSFVADGEVHDDMATSHTPWFGTTRARSPNRTDRGMAPAGGVVASANDLGRYLLMMMNGEDDVLSAEGKALMVRPASSASPFYGLGWFLDTAQGTAWHSGTVPGAESLATMVPAEGRGAVVLVNGGSGTGFGETADLRNAVTAAATGTEYSGGGSRWSQKALFVGMVLLPVGYLLSTVWAWRHRAALRAKTGLAGRLSLWFPLLTTSIAAWVMLALVPTLFGAPLGTIRRFQPDLGLLLLAGAVTGVLWAVLRLGVASTRTPGSR